MATPPPAVQHNTDSLPSQQTSWSQAPCHCSQYRWNKERLGGLDLVLSIGWPGVGNSFCTQSTRGSAKMRWQRKFETLIFQVDWNNFFTPVSGQWFASRVCIVCDMQHMSICTWVVLRRYSSLVHTFGKTFELATHVCWCHVHVFSRTEFGNPKLCRCLSLLKSFYRTSGYTL